MTVTPAAANRGAWAFDVVAPAEKIAEVPFGEELAHDGAHLAGGADDADPQAVAAVPVAGDAHRPVPP
jgi:hypothetical protein